MKKIRYYAPYWVSAIVIITIVLAIVLSRKSEPHTLSYYARTMESNDYFLRDDHSIWQFSKELYNGYTKISPTGESFKKVKNYTNNENLEQMSLHEFALMTYDTAYIRRDGSVWVAVGVSSTKLPNTVIALKAIDYELDPTSPPQLSASLSAASSYTVRLNMTNNSDTEISTPYAYLFVQLEDGNWYPYTKGFEHNVTVHGEYTHRGDRMEIDHEPNLQPGATAKYYIALPRNQYIHSTVIGHYCIAVFSNAYYDYRQSGENAVYTTYPIGENAELIAAIEFDLVPKNEIDHKLTNFESSIEDFTLPALLETLPAS